MADILESASKSHQKFDKGTIRAEFCLTKDDCRSFVISQGLTVDYTIDRLMRNEAYETWRDRPTCANR